MDKAARERPVRVHINEHGSIVLCALVPFAAECWPWYSSPGDMRAYCKEHISGRVASLAGQILGTIEAYSDDHILLRERGLRWKGGAHASLVEFAARFVVELQERIRSAPIDSGDKTSLRLDVDNS